MFWRLIWGGLNLSRSPKKKPVKIHAYVTLGMTTSKKMQKTLHFLQKCIRRRYIGTKITIDTTRNRLFVLLIFRLLSIKISKKWITNIRMIVIGRGSHQHYSSQKSGSSRKPYNNATSAVRSKLLSFSCAQRETAALNDLRNWNDWESFVTGTQRNPRVR